MAVTVVNTSSSPALPGAGLGVSFGILLAISSTHLINDMMQSVLLALYPLLQGSYSLSFVQIGLITVAFQCSASLLQPLIGLYTDKHPMPWLLPAGMGFTVGGLILLSRADSYPLILLAAALIGVGSAVFHPESSRIARMASAGKHGLAQSIFQVGGTMGSAVGPLLAAAFIVPFGQPSVAWVALLALVGVIVLTGISRWHAANINGVRGRRALKPGGELPANGKVRLALTLLLILMFSKFVYLASLNSYFTFYLIDNFGLGIQQAQYSLFIFMFGSALGTIAGGPLGDRFGRKKVILGSILGAAPFSLALPFVSLPLTLVLVFIVGFIIASAFPAIVVYGQELVPGKTGAISGLFFGLSFGIAGIGAAAIGALADFYSIETVYRLCALLPLLGLVAFMLPDMRRSEP
ncbi:MFS transporter [Thiopseudomonas denitrificans]|uniref:MFS transporter n=1 Tax=Thiopseudomonas denitrificans TaxID=1501432 RepID=UPI00197D48B6